MRKIKNGTKGFTLLELLVVVLIIGILAAIALPQYQMVVGKTKFATLKDNARVIKEAMDRYYLAHGDFTTNLEMLDIELNGNLDEAKSTIVLNNGSQCSIGASSIFCSRKIFKILMEYAVGYKTNKISCISNSTDLTDRANRLCQLDTGKSTPRSECRGYCSYSYQ